MSKFNKAGAKALATQPGTTTGTTTTYEGGAAWVRDECSELLLLAVSNMVGEDTFYEKATDRDARYSKLVRAVADPEWMLGFIHWLRNSANMRSAAVVAACEAVKARLATDADEKLRNFRGFDFNAPGFPRRFIDAACARADEPGEIISYWTSHYGRGIPQPVKRGVADAVARLYSGKTVIKYDSRNSAVRFGDVLELTHPSPAADKPWQGDLFKYILDERHHPENATVPETNKTLTNYRQLMAVPVEGRHDLLSTPGAAEMLSEAGMTWESLAGWLQGPMDKKAWEAIIPSMGAMALVRNLRNFDEAEVSDKVAGVVCEKISDTENIRLSKMFPYRMLMAYRQAPSLRWGHALDKALDAACQNVPALNGRTLVLVDTSSSMTGGVSGKSGIRHVDIGALFGVALAMRGNDVDLFGFANDVFPHNLVRGGSALKQIEAFCQKIGVVGHGTQTVQAIKSSFVPGVHKRVVVITDGQAFASYGGGSVSTAVPADIPLFGIDTTGYRKSSLDTSKPNRYEIGGFSDAMFTVLGVLADGKRAGWPWEMNK
jgi:TROVE domain